MVQIKDIFFGCSLLFIIKRVQVLRQRSFAQRVNEIVRRNIQHNNDLDFIIHSLIICNIKNKTKVKNKIILIFFFIYQLITFRKAY